MILRLSLLRIALATAGAAALWWLGEAGPLVWLAPLAAVAGAAVRHGLDLHDPSPAPPDELPSARLARAQPLVLGALALLAAVAVWRRPDSLAADVPLLLLVLAVPLAPTGYARRYRAGIVARVRGDWRSAVPAAAVDDLLRSRRVAIVVEGALTVGEPRVAQVESFVDDLAPEEILRRAAALARSQPSAYSDALAHSARRARLALPKLAEAERVESLGWRAGLEDERYYLGDGALAEWLGHDPEPFAELSTPASAGQVVLWLMDEQRVLGLVVMEDPEAPGATHQARGLRYGGVAQVVAMTAAPPAAAERMRQHWGLDQVVPSVDFAAQAAVVDEWRAAHTLAAFAAPAFGEAALAAGRPAVAVVGDESQVAVPAMADAAAVATPEGSARLAAPWLHRDAARMTDTIGARLGASMTFALALVAALVGLPFGLAVLLHELGEAVPAALLFRAEESDGAG